MKTLDLSKLPIANKKIDEFRQCNVKNILNLEFKENSFENKEIDSFEFLKNYELNLVFYINEKLAYKNLCDNISIDKNEFIINKDCCKPLVVLNYYKDEKTLFEKDIKYIIDTDAKVEIFEIFESSGSENYINEQRKFCVDKASNVEYIKLQNLSKEDFINIVYEQIIHDDSNLNFFSFDYGSSNAYYQYDTNLEYVNTKFDFEAIININGYQEVANIIRTFHNNKHTKSSVQSKQILDGNAHGIYEAKSIVNEGGKYSDVVQNTQSTLLSDDARANTNPRMEIYIDELTAAHGATSGSLDEEALYYLQSRGLSKNKASQVILESIKNRIINKISNEKIIEIYKKVVKY